MVNGTLKKRLTTISWGSEEMLWCQVINDAVRIGALKYPKFLIILFRSVDQIIDRTKGIRHSTFFDGSAVGHAMFGHPFDTQLSAFILPHIKSAIESFDNHVNPEDLPRLHRDKTLVVMEGPQFSTKAESIMYRAWGGDIINMSSIPESKLAREAELRYAPAFCKLKSLWNP